MKSQMFSIYDQKAKFFSTPFYAPNLPVAARSIAKAMSDPASDLGTFSNDYTLYCVGSFDDQTGVLEQSTPENLGPIIQFKLEDK
ncbi:MAG: nonstructural protein [Microvirus sp.]|nr:MAG: nonstructural protein [Microvirus sp.]